MDTWSVCHIHLQVDPDVFVNLPHLAAALAGAGSFADYVGRPYDLFSFKHHRLPFMHGGMYALSHRAAIAVSDCVLGEWSACPNHAIVDMVNTDADQVCALSEHAASL